MHRLNLSSETQIEATAQVPGGQAVALRLNILTVRARSQFFAQYLIFRSKILDDSLLFLVELSGQE